VHPLAGVDLYLLWHGRADSLREHQSRDDPGSRLAHPPLSPWNRRRLSWLVVTTCFALFEPSS